MSRCRARPLSTPSRRFRRPLVRGVSWLVIAALLGLLVMPMAAVAGPAGAGVVSICTAHGPEPMTVDADGRAVPLEKQQGRTGSACPFCTAHAGYTVPPPLALLPVPALAAGREGRPAAASPIVPRCYVLTGHPSRAPPFPAV